MKMFIQVNLDAIEYHIPARLQQSLKYDSYGTCRYFIGFNSLFFSSQAANHVCKKGDNALTKPSSQCSYYEVLSTSTYILYTNFLQCQHYF